MSIKKNNFKFFNENFKKEYWLARAEASNFDDMFFSEQQHQILDEVEIIMSNEEILEDIETYPFNMIYAMAVDSLYNKGQLIHKKITS